MQLWRVIPIPDGCNRTYTVVAKHDWIKIDNSLLVEIMEAFQAFHRVIGQNRRDTTSFWRGYSLLLNTFHSVQPTWAGRWFCLPKQNGLGGILGLFIRWDVDHRTQISTFRQSSVRPAPRLANAKEPSRRVLDQCGAFPGQMIDRIEPGQVHPTWELLRGNIDRNWVALLWEASFTNQFMRVGFRITMVTVIGWDVPGLMARHPQLGNRLADARNRWV